MVQKIKVHSTHNMMNPNRHVCEMLPDEVFGSDIEEWRVFADFEQNKRTVESRRLA